LSTPGLLNPAAGLLLFSKGSTLSPYGKWLSAIYTNGQRAFRKRKSSPNWHYDEANITTIAATVETAATKHSKTMRTMMRSVFVSTGWAPSNCD
jgi:hypothetical protein